MNEITIEAGRAERQYWHDLWRYRELFYFLAWRDILVRYKQTVIGVAWGVIRPVLTTIVLTFAFHKVAKMQTSNGIPYELLVFCGLLPWQFFATAFSESGNSLVANSGMISKVYFPRLVVPVSSVITSFVDFLISSAILGVMMVYFHFSPYHYTLGAGIVFLPIFIILAFATAFASGLWISALMVRYRDFRYIVPFVVQFGLYLSPVAFSSTVVPSEWRLLYSVNPMVGVIDGFRWTVLGETMYWPGFYLSVGVVVLLTISGIWYFRRTERTFADVI